MFVLLWREQEAFWCSVQKKSFKNIHFTRALNYKCLGHFIALLCRKNWQTVQTILKN